MKTGKKQPVKATTADGGDTARIRCAKAKISFSQYKRAKDLGFDVGSVDELIRYRESIGRRAGKTDVDELDDEPGETPPPGTEALQLTIEDIETRLLSKALTYADARLYKEQLAGLKAAMAYRQQQNQLIPRAAVADSFNKIAAAVNAAMRVAETEIPQVCAGLDLSQSKPKAKECLRKIQATLANGESEFWKEFPESELMP